MSLKVYFFKPDNIKINHLKILTFLGCLLIFQFQLKETCEAFKTFISI